MALVLAAPAAHCAETPASEFEVARRFAEVGAPSLALKRVERFQPEDPRDPAWQDWERLRLRSLQAVGGDKALLERLSGLPPDAGALLEPDLALAGARAALREAQPDAARGYLARSIWSGKPDAPSLRELRRLLIRTYVDRGRIQDAYHAMLRFQQDYRPLDPAEAEEFVTALSRKGMHKEAVPWLPQLKEGSPRAIEVRLRAGLITPGQAVARARDNLGKVEDPGFWEVVLAAAEVESNPSATLEALERLLGVPPSRQREPVDAERLWHAYETRSEALVNQHQLLVGDDGSWLVLAESLRSSDAPGARALLASIADRGRQSDTRARALGRLLESLRADGLVLVGPRLLARASGELPPDLRYSMGLLAWEAGNAELGLRFWDGLDPPGVAPGLWRLQLAAALADAGRGDEARRGLDERSTRNAVWPKEQAESAIAVARRLQVRGEHAVAAAVLEAALPALEPAQHLEALQLLARASEGRGQWQSAAEHYLEVALQPGVPAPVALASRLGAARALARAGLSRESAAQLRAVAETAAAKDLKDALLREAGDLAARKR